MHHAFRRVQLALISIAILVLLFGLVGWVIYLLLPHNTTPARDQVVVEPAPYEDLNRELVRYVPDQSILNATGTVIRKPYKLIGRSLEGREIQSYKYGDGPIVLLVVGGIHGGYEWNTVLLAYQLIDELIPQALTVPDDMTVLVVPTLNPDGLYRVVGTSERFGLSKAPQFVNAGDVLPTDVVVSGRFNARGVDLNRNFDCNWKPHAVWRSYTVSAGEGPFSEPESRALRDFILTERPAGVIFLQSGSDGIYSSGCGGKTLPDTLTLLETYSRASGYKPYTDYTYYSVTGDATDWLASMDTPAITVELRTHNELEWDQNRTAMQEVFRLYSRLE